MLTDIEYLTWAMAEAGVSQRSIAEYRRVSKGAVSDTLRVARIKVEEAVHGTHRKA